MTNEEFSNEFDTLANSYSKMESFGKVPTLFEFDEYEKSIYLTKAQEEVIRNLYNGKNVYGDSFEKTEEIRRYLSSLVKTQTFDIQILLPEKQKVSSASACFSLPADLLFITYEAVKFVDNSLPCVSNTDILVIPVTQDEYYRIVRNPFKGPNERRVLRLDLENNMVELVSKYQISEYKVRYLTKPSPIILSTLPEGLTINGISEETDCKLHPMLHRVILESAVKLAITSKALGATKE